MTLGSLVLRILIAGAAGAAILWQIRARRRSKGMSIDPRTRR